MKTHAHSKTRLGRLTTPHGMVDTPPFMSMGTQIILGNTYHLYLRSGLEVIRAAAARAHPQTAPIVCQ